MRPAITSLLFLTAFLLSFIALAQDDSAPDLTSFYDRLAGDLLDNKPMITTAYVALCDNDSQGIVPVKNKKICRGDDPENNLYWATSGGLYGWAKKHGWKRVFKVENPDATVMVTAIWKKTFRPGGELKSRGVTDSFDAFIVGLAYRGSKIERAMVDYLHAVNHDDAQTLKLKDGSTIEYGGSGHVVGYLGHDYFLDVYGDAAAPLFDESRGKSTAHKATFAFACVGNQFIRPAVTRPNVYILMLNKDLAYPGAWTVGGIMDGIAQGKSPAGIHRRAARAFAIGMEAPPGSRFRAFAHGP